MSKLEAGQLIAQFRPVQLDQLTIDMASLFQSMAEKKGVKLQLEVQNQVGAVPPTYVDIRESLSGVFRLVYLQFLGNQCCGRRSSVICEHDQLRDRWMCLNGIWACRLSNAFKYTTKGKITVSVTYDFTFAYLRVCDTGIGIPLEKQQEVFKQFHRVHDLVRPNLYDDIETTNGLSSLWKVRELDFRSPRWVTEIPPSD